ncbi:MAG: arginine--tRNA ligase [Chloroflexi bacterium]|nr:arginine--tRNA ligase [Chloroflexota bacterium]
MVSADAEIKAALHTALQHAQQAGELPAGELLAEIPLERPKDETLGDLATPISMQLARILRLAPIQIAETLVRHMPVLESIAELQAVRPGYINMRYRAEWLTNQIEAILSAPEHFGEVSLGEGRSVQVEFVSANPTGPLHIGAARNAVLGDTVARVLEAAGYRVEREYYVNDAGSRVRMFGETLYARYAQALGVDAEMPADGYMGAYMVEMGSAIVAEAGRQYLEMERSQAVADLGREGLRRVVADIESDLALMGIHYNRWFSEASLYHDGTYDTAIAILERGGYLEQHDGALWFKASAFGVNKDEVVVRSDGTPGYFASDIAYHYDKFVLRGFDRVIDVWGADHQGHVPRMHAMLQGLGIDPQRLTILLYQLVTLKRSGEIVRLSKRTGDIITLREVLSEVGSDAVRFFLLARDANSQMDFDLDLAKEQSDANPVFYVQYAHARTCSILRHATDIDYSAGDLALLTEPAEQTLMRRMIRLPDVVRLAAQNLEPHHLTYYAQELASALHAFYRDCRVVNLEPGTEAITAARLKLVAACRIALARTLVLMGMSAPEVM